MLTLNTKYSNRRCHETELEQRDWFIALHLSVRWLHGLEY